MKTAQVEVKVNKALARKVLEVVDAGLVSGLGKPVPGQMCVEAAVNFAMGRDHGDQPSCVGSSVRRFKIALNDARWPSNKDRTEGMRKLSIAQLGSDAIDQKEFSKIVCIETVRQILPIAFRAAGALIPKFKDAFEAASVCCEAVVDLASARAAASAGRETALRAKSNAYADADAYAAAAAAAYAADAAAAAAYAYAAAAAAAAAYAAYAAAYAAAAAASKKRLAVLRLCAKIGLDALIALKSPGRKWLDLCD